MKSARTTLFTLAFLLLFTVESRAARLEHQAHGNWPELAVSLLSEPLPEPQSECTDPLVSGEWLLRVEQLLGESWTVGGQTATSAMAEFATRGLANSGSDDPGYWERSAAAPLSLPAPDRLADVWFVQNALALGVLASYFRSAGRDVNDGNVLGYLPTTTDLQLQLCLTYWLSNNVYLTPALLYSRASQRQRTVLDDRYLTAVNLYGLSVGAGYFKPCFTRFGLMTGADLAFQLGNTVNKFDVQSPPFEDKTQTNLWEAQASGYLGVWYAMNRYLVTAQLGLLSYRYRNTENSADIFELDYRQRQSEFLVGLDTKQFALGLRYLLNKRSGSSE